VETGVPPERTTSMKHALARRAVRSTWQESKPWSIRTAE